MKKREILILLATILFSVAYVAPVLAADGVNPCRYSSPEGWRFQILKRFDPGENEDKIAILRAIGRVPPAFDMIMNNQHEYDWLHCAILVPEMFSLVVGPDTKVIIKRDSVEIVSIKLIFTDHSFMQYWDSQVAPIWLGLSEETDIYAAKPGKITFDGKKIRAISYAGFVLVPAHSGITTSNIKEVRLTGVRVEEPRNLKDERK